MNNKLISKAVDVLKAGGIIAYPTEGVWGIGCDPWNKTAFDKILTLKKRSIEKGVILIAGHTTQVEPLLAQLKASQKATLYATWPGPYTWIIPCEENTIPKWISGNYHTVALRVSDHPIVQALCQQMGSPIVSTSANITDEPPAQTEQEVRAYFKDGIDFILPGQLGGRTSPSFIYDAQTGERLR
jgi:L-threonylcarbamoyladenylate synthase